MFSLPAIPKQPKQANLPPQNRSFLRIAQHPSPRFSLQRDALMAVSQKRYLYIDFQSNNSLIDLEQQDANQYESQDEFQQIGSSSISGLSQLQRMCEPSFKMHKFLNEERNYIQKRRNWNRLLAKEAFRESIIDFNSLREQLHPEDLEEFLQKKDIQARWNKIIAREELLFPDTPHRPSPGQAHSGDRPNRHTTRYKLDKRAELSSKWKFKKLQALNLLLN